MYVYGKLGSANMIYADTDAEKVMEGIDPQKESSYLGRASTSSVNHKKITKRQLKAIIREGCGLDKLYLSIKQSGQRYPEEIKLIHDSVDHFRRPSLRSLLPGFLTADSRSKTSTSIKQEFANSREGKRLHRKAAANNFISIERYMRTQHVDINHKSEKSGNSPLIAAGLNKQWSMVETLLNAGVEVERFGDHPKIDRVFGLAIEDNINTRKHNNMVLQLIIESNRGIKNERGDVDLISWATNEIIRNGRFAMMKTIIDYRLSALNREDQVSYNSLRNSFARMLLIGARRDSARMIKYALGCKFADGRKIVNPNAKNTHKMTPLMVAVNNRSINAAKELLKDSKARDGINYKLGLRTAYTIAHADHNTEMMRLLANNGADTSQISRLKRYVRVDSSDSSDSSSGFLIWR